MARTGFSKSVGGPKTIVVSLAGMTLEALVARTRKIAMPESGRILAITLNVGAKGGTPGTDTLDVLAGATSLLAAVFNLNTIVAGTPVEKVTTALSATALATIAKDTVISITTAQSGGTSPTIAAADLQIDYMPVGD